MIVFDIDGARLDSAPGIVAGFQHALRSVGFAPPTAETLQGDLDPPVGDILVALGLSESRVPSAVAAYRSFYREFGLQQPRPYEGVVGLPTELWGAGVRLATATVKRTDTARAILDHHGLGTRFEVNGTDDRHHTKAETLDHALELLVRPPPHRGIMVGERC